jgi:8-oxo-dGTP diphosphatase
MHRISAGAIIESGGRLLLVRHQRPERYDFWVSPGGGVEGAEALAEAAAREALEETGVEVRTSKLAYVEELSQPGVRHVKFWFAAVPLQGTLSVAHPEAKAEYIVEAAWLGRSELEGKTVFPPVLLGRYWQDREQGFPGVVHLPLRPMQFW